jgi:hypothetical protein
MLTRAYSQVCTSTEKKKEITGGKKKKHINVGFFLWMRVQVLFSFPSKKNAEKRKKRTKKEERERGCKKDEAGLRVRGPKLNR